MCCILCPRLHRHQIHLIRYPLGIKIYGLVSFSLISTGLVFTIFAIFQKDSQIGKVWLAGPTTMVVGLVLCGKYQFMLPNGETKLPLPRTSLIMENANTKYNSIMRSKDSPNHSIQRISSQNYRSIEHHTNLLRESHLITSSQQTLKNTRAVGQGTHVQRMLAPDMDPGMEGAAFDCIIYSKVDSGSDSNASSYAGLCNACEKEGSVKEEEAPPNPRPQSPADDSQSTRRSTPTSRPHRTTTPRRECNCTHIAGNRCTAAAPPPAQPKQHHLCSHGNGVPSSYGAINESVPPSSPRQLFQGETFVINEKSYFI
ncbi:hypothetical protein M3Y99_01447900 [Aphelenchoides fujianensis]|nr:hypothetical protein M3Y99_01447900 [Aphelenchoides fujianensis]